jgi:hypothetical protein
MSEQSAQDTEQDSQELSEQAQQRRNFLGGLGKWSSASVMAAIGSAAWLSTSGNASAAWVNRRGGGGNWVNRGGGGGAWVNRRGGGAWANRR